MRKKLNKKKSPLLDEIEQKKNSWNFICSCFTIYNFICKTLYCNDC